MSGAPFTAGSRIHDVLGGGADARRLLWDHGYDAGEGFADALSQYQSLDDAARAGRLRDLPGLLQSLNSSSAGRKK